MKTTREILQAVVMATPKITIDVVQADGNVAFHVAMKELSLTREDCLNPVIRTRFFVDFMGQLLVRENIMKFSVILKGLDPALYNKLVFSQRGHAGFGMVIDHKYSTMTFQMHLTFVQDLMTEFDRQEPEQHSNPDDKTLFDDFDHSMPDDKTP